MLEVREDALACISDYVGVEALVTSLVKLVSCCWHQALLNKGTELGVGVA
jgi:hypothetical protein